MRLSMLSRTEFEGDRKVLHRGLQHKFLGTRLWGNEVQSLEAAG